MFANLKGSSLAQMSYLFIVSPLHLSGICQMFKQ